MWRYNVLISLFDFIFLRAEEQAEGYGQVYRVLETGEVEGSMEPAVPER